MRLIELYAEEFGCLVDRRFSFGEGLHIIEGANESGKSTVMALLRFLFYGFPRRGGEGGEERERRLSRKGRRAAGQVLFLWQGKEIVLRRDLVLHTTGGKEVPSERVQVFERQTGEAIPLGTKSAGEVFFGLPAALYDSSACVRQSDLDGVSRAQTGDAVSDLLFLGAGGARLERAQRLLDEARRALQHQRGTGGRIAALEDELDANAAAYAVAAENAARAYSLNEEKRVLERELASATEALQRLAAEQEAARLSFELARYDEWHRALAAEAAAEADWHRAAAATDGGDDERWRVEKIKRWCRMGVLLLAVFAVFAVLFGVCAVLLPPVRAVLCAAFAVSLATAVLLFVLTWRARQRRGALLTALRSRGEAHAAAVARARAAFEQARSVREALAGGLDPATEQEKRAALAALPTPRATQGELTVRCRELEAEIAALQTRLRHTEREEAACRARDGSPVLLQERLLRVQDELTVARRRLAAIKMASEALHEADAALRGGVLPSLAARAGALLQRLTDGVYRRLHISKDFVVSPEVAEGVFPLSHFSAGACDVVCFALRLALVELITDEPLPLLLDEVCARLDDTRAARVLDFLSAYCEGGAQCLLFTCHTREAGLLGDRPYRHILLSRE